MNARPVECRGAERQAMANEQKCGPRAPGYVPRGREEALISSAENETVGVAGLDCTPCEGCVSSRLKFFLTQFLTTEAGPPTPMPLKRPRSRGPRRGPPPRRVNRSPSYHWRPLDAGWLMWPRDCPDGPMRRWPRRAARRARRVALQLVSQREGRIGERAVGHLQARARPGRIRRGRLGPSRLPRATSKVPPRAYAS